MCDLVNATTISEKLSPEELGELLSSFYVEGDADVKVYGGRVIRCVGDAIYAVFDSGYGKRESAIYAANAALRLRRKISNMSVALNGATATLSTRISIASGKGLLSYIPITNQETIYGELPFIADRLKGFAEENEIVVNNHCAQLIGSAFELKGGKEEQVKGVSKPEQVWKLNRKKSATKIINYWAEFAPGPTCSPYSIIFDNFRPVNPNL